MISNYIKWKSPLKYILDSNRLSSNNKIVIQLLGKLNKLERDYFLVAAKTMIMVVPYRTVRGEALAFICNILQSFKEYLEKN
jgi:hypothetical protein